MLKAVRVEDAYANLALPHALDRHRLQGRDAAFATELVSGTLRGQGLYDAVLAAAIDRPLAKVQAKVRDALRLGAHQLLAMRVPDHAAIATTVDLIKSESGPGAGSFANAVLRQVAARSREEWIADVAPPAARDPHGHLAVATSHPRWVVDRLADALAQSGETTPESGGITRNSGELSALLEADNAAPRVTLVARPGRIGREDLRDAVGGESTGLSPFGVRLPGGTPAGIEAIAAGRAGVQDEGSQLVALACAEATVTDAEGTWLDLCAGPGGKSALLAGLAAERGAHLVAHERQPHRARLVRNNLTAADGSLVPGVAGVVAGDGLRPPFPDSGADRVLVDAPCTGLGALRRRPEARWRRRESDLGELVPLQRGLLEAALDLTRPGGVVLYATCSPLLAETAEVVTAVLEAREDVALEPVVGLVGEIENARGPLPGTVQLWPHRHGTDAMFLALLRRH